MKHCISRKPCEECEYGLCKSNWDDCEEWGCNMPTELNETIEKLLKAFPRSFINDNGEFIAHLRTNQYIILNNCKTSLDIKCKVLEWFSRPAHKTAPYSQEWRNKNFHEFMLKGINDFLETNFSVEQISDIYDELGNAINHERTIEFIGSNYDFGVLNCSRLISRKENVCER
jgi:hypothetical protein